MDRQRFDLAQSAANYLCGGKSREYRRCDGKAKLAVRGLATFQTAVLLAVTFPAQTSQVFPDIRSALLAVRRIARCKPFGPEM
jgi:hypothetical protein